MDKINLVVAQNIKRLREERRLSMDELSMLCDISKSMLSQIERGTGNPTLASLWKISNGLGVPFDALTVRPKPACEVIRHAEIQPILEDGGRVRNYSVFPDDENRRFSVYCMELEPGSRWQSEPHFPGTTEFITVFGGAVEISTAGQVFSVAQGESIRFRGDTAHSYRNAAQGLTTLHMILYNP